MNNKSWTRLILAMVMAFVLAVRGPDASQHPAQAAGPFTVDWGSDSTDAAPGNGTCADGGGHCTLRAAVMESNALAGDDVIILPGGIYTLTLPGEDANANAGDLDITDNLTIQGTGNPIIGVDSSQITNDNVFTLFSDRLDITGVTLRGAQTASSGGAVYNLNGELTVANSTLMDLQAYYGGAIYQTGAEATTTIADTLILSNFATRGGAIYVAEGSAALVDSTLQRNDATNHGGGIYLEGGSLAVVNSQVISNTADDNGGGFYGLSGAVWLTRTLVISNSAGSFGGGLINSAALTLTQSTVSNNIALVTGGGLYHAGGNARVEASTFSGNGTGDDGGGISVAGTLALVNSTLSGNRADGSGGGLFVYSIGTANLYNITIAGNSADFDYDGAGLGGGIAVVGTLNLRNTLIANNLNRTNPIIIPQPTDDCNGTIASLDNNLIEDTDGCTIVNGNSTNRLGVDPALGPLQANGGPTDTRALLPGSPALDAGNSEACLGPGGVILQADQRGLPRHADGNLDGSGRCDIGAFEVVLQLWLPAIMRP